MFPFWTVTNENTSHTNERSSRFGSEKAAISEATSRIQSGRTESVVILKAVKLIRRRPQPEIETIEIE